MSAVVEEVAIIGAGPGGLALALALKQQNIPCKIYELRADYSDILSSGVALYPNGSRVLDAIGVLDEVTKGVWTTTQMTFLNEKDEHIFTLPGGIPERHGYPTFRFYRLRMIEVMKRRLQELGVPIVYDSKFEGVVEETSDQVSFKVSGRVETASLLVGSDGIHSAVRKHITSTVAEYTGLLAVLTHVPAENFTWPSTTTEKTLTMMGPPGGLIMIPEDDAATDMLIGMQLSHEDLGREGWEALSRDEDRMLSYFTRYNGQWTASQQVLVDSIVSHKGKLFVWPFRKLPTLDSWASPSGRVVLIGDAAHTIPPSSAQGVNQVLEDAYTLSRLLVTAPAGTSLPEMFATWRKWRLARIAQILRMTAISDAMRAPPETRHKLEAEGKLKGLMATPEALQEISMRIYAPDYDADMAGVLQEVKSAGAA